VRDEFGRSMLALQRAQPKMGLETVIVEGPEGRGRQGALALGRGGFRFLTVTNEPTFLPVELVPPPPGGLVSPLARFDTNSNNRLDDPEFFGVIDAWLAGEIDNALFFEAIARPALLDASRARPSRHDLRCGRATGLRADGSRPDADAALAPSRPPGQRRLRGRRRGRADGRNGHAPGPKAPRAAVVAAVELEFGFCYAGPS